MATHCHLTDLNNDTDLLSLQYQDAPRHSTTDLKLTVKSLQAEVGGVCTTLSINREIF